MYLKLSICTVEQSHCWSCNKSLTVPYKRMTESKRFWWLHKKKVCCKEQKPTIKNRTKNILQAKELWMKAIHKWWDIFGMRRKEKHKTFYKRCRRTMYKEYEKLNKRNAWIEILYGRVFFYLNFQTITLVSPISLFHLRHWLIDIVSACDAIINSAF